YDARHFHWVEKLFSPHFTAQDFFTRAYRAKRVEEIYSTAIIKFQEETGLKRKKCLSKLIVREAEPNLVGAKINISKEETEGDSACCGAGNLDVGTEESLKETEGHCIWNAKELAALRQEMHKNHLEGVSLKLQLSSLNARLRELTLEQIERDSLKNDLELQALKQDLHEKSAHVRSLNEELLQAREEIQNLELKNKDLQQEFKKLKQQQEKIKRELESVKIELSAEKVSHARSCKALERLRKHFSVQPLSDTFDNLSVDSFKTKE
uniref:Coiled-coil domain containing 160 n=1 Tax=Crocodylus porosus TaxID=8502 RepID=A0A7M4EKC0_CROPO